MNVLIYYLLDHLLLFETLILSEYIGRAYWNESYLSTDLNCYLIWAYLVQLICRNEWLVVFMCRRLGVPLAGFIYYFNLLNDMYLPTHQWYL